MDQINANKLTKQALQVYEYITRKLDVALVNQKKFPVRGQRTTAYMALQGHISRLYILQAKAHKRYLRRHLKEAPPA